MLEEIGQVELTTAITWSERRQRPQQLAATRKAVKAGVDLVHRGHLGAGILGFDDPLEAAVGAPDDAAIGASRIDDAGQRGRGPGLPVGPEDALQGLRPQERLITVDHEQLTLAE